MRKVRLTLALVMVLAAAMVAQQPRKGGDDLTGPYEVVPNWPQNPCGPGYQGGSVGGVFAETPDRVFVFQRGCLPAIDHGNDIVPERNASGYDLSQTAADRHPRWDKVLLIYNRDGKIGRAHV